MSRRRRARRRRSATSRRTVCRQSSKTVRVDCDAHGWMEGWIYVVDNPYYAVTGADGKFSITDVPPGDYKLVAVQPFTGPIEMPVKVTAGQPSKLEIELKK